MASSIFSHYCLNILSDFNTVKDCATDKYEVFIQPAVVLHFLKYIIVEPMKLKYKDTQHTVMKNVLWPNQYSSQI